MKRSISLSLMLAILSLTFTNCSKHDEVFNNEVKTNYIPADLKEYAIFKPGSFWLYKNEITGKIDSTYLADSLYFIYSHEGGYDYDPILERCLIRYRGSFIQQADISSNGYVLFFKTFSFTAITQFLSILVRFSS